MSKESVEIVKRAIDAFSDKAVGDFAALTTADLEWKVGLAAVEGEVFRGREGIETYFARLSSAWAEFRFLAEEFRDLGDVVLVFGRLEGLGRAGGVPVVSPVCAVWELRDGLIFRLRAYLDRGEALKAVGLEG